MQAEPSYLADPVIERFTTGRQSLHSEHLAPRLWTDRNAVSDRVPQQGCHRIVVHRITRQVAVLHIPFQQTLAFQKAPYPVGDGVRQSGEFGAARRLHPTEPCGSKASIDIHAIQKQHVEMNVEVKRTAEALDQRDGTRSGRVVCIARFPDQMRGDDTVNDAQHAGHDLGPAGKQEAQLERETQHPLAHGLFG